MITLALDTATDRCTVAATDGTRVAARALDGARQHNAAILGFVGEVLQELGAATADIGRVLTADGPGSFTGLRVSTAVAKGLVWRRSNVTWAVAPSLLVRAAAHAPRSGGVVLALADALRGEVYAGAWRITPDAVEEVLPPLARRPEELPAGADVVVGSFPAVLTEAIAAATGRPVVTGPSALPDARTFFALDARQGGVRPLDNPAHWEPAYGRPAEAQAVWERNHGRPLPVATDRLD